MCRSIGKELQLALKKPIGEQVLTPFEFYQCPIGRIPNDLDDGSYLARMTYCVEELRLKYHEALSEIQENPATEWNLSKTSLTRFGNVGQGMCCRHYFRERSGMQKSET